MRNSALGNGFFIGVGVSSFGAGYLAHYFYGTLAHVTSIISEIAPEGSELLTSVEVLKAAGDKALLGCVIVGIICLAIGIGNEAYQRAKGAKQS